MQHITQALDAFELALGKASNLQQVNIALGLHLRAPETAGFVRRYNRALGRAEASFVLGSCSVQVISHELTAQLREQVLDAATSYLTP